MEKKKKREKKIKKEKNGNKPTCTEVEKKREEEGEIERVTNRFEEAIYANFVRIVKQ